MSEIKPCPCCGHEADMIIHKGIGKDRYYVRCPKCSIQTSELFSEQSVLDRWNKRDKANKRIAELEAEVAALKENRSDIADLLEIEAKAGNKLKDDNERLLTTRLSSVRYMGNSIQHWYLKAKAYTESINKVWDALGTADGKTHVHDAVAELKQCAEKAEATVERVNALPRYADDCGSLYRDDEGEIVLWDELQAALSQEEKT